jgi:hypothetical protein
LGVDVLASQDRLLAAALALRHDLAPFADGRREERDPALPPKSA